MNKLDKVFKHSKWFKGEKLTVAEALDQIASCEDFYLDKIKKRQKGMEINLLAPVEYEEVIKYASRKEKSYYKLSQEEKDFYLKRIEHHEKIRELKKQDFLNKPVNFQKRISILLAGNSYYNLDDNVREMNYAIERNDKESVIFWKQEIEKTKESRKLLEEFIYSKKDQVKTNRDFKQFEEELEKLYDKIDQLQAV